MGEPPHLLEPVVPRGSRPVAHQIDDLGLQPVHVRIGVTPRVRERRGIEPRHETANLLELQQPRPFGHEQPDRQLDRRHRLDQIQVDDRLQQIAVALARGPGRERDEGGRQRQAGRPAHGDGALDVRARVPLAQPRQHGVVERLHRARDQDAARGAQFRKQARVGEEVLDLDRDVEGQVRELARNPSRDVERVARAVEKVRIAEGDVSGASLDLRADVGQDDVGGNDAKAAVVDGHNRTVAAEVLAAPAGLRVAGNAARAVAETDRRIARERRKALAVRGTERETRRVARRRREPVGHLPAAVEPASERDQVRLELAAEHRLHAARAEHGRVGRRVEAEAAEVRAGIVPPHAIEDG